MTETTVGLLAEDRHHVSRRRMLGLTMGAAAWPLLGPIFPAPARAASPSDLRFRALYQGSPAGEHRVAFRPQGDRLMVTTHIDITVRVLFFTAFRFAHEGVEVWQSGRLVSVESSTDDNGTMLEVSGHAADDGFRIRGADGPYLASARLLTSNTLWDHRLLRESRMIDVQYGSVVGLVVKPLGPELVDTPQGRVTARRYRMITPNYAGSLFFDDKGRWVKGLMERQGEILEYALAS